MTADTVTAVSCTLSQTAALRLVGMARSSWHYRHHPRPRVAEQVAHTARRSDRWLTPAEEEVIVAWLTAAQWQATSIGELFTIAWDAGVYVGSRRSWYRVARRQVLPQRPPRRVAKHPPRAIPELVAIAPDQVWSWDIERHEALLNRAVVKGHRLRLVAASR